MRNLLPFLPRPAHYAGIEEGVILKNPASASLRIALCFPDAYEIGMSYLGHKILYDIINRHPGWLAERAMAPEPAAAAILREKATSLATLETGTPLRKMDVLGFSITHELCYTDVLHMLDLAGIPLRHENRPEDLKACPLIIAGGGAMLAAEPLAPFLDLALLGDGEELLPEVLEAFESARARNLARSGFLLEAARIPGVYVPSLFKKGPGGTLESIVPGYRPARRIVANLDATPYPIRQVVPVGAIHNRLALEIARGCGRGCRFCQAGIVYRPVRERQPETISKMLDESLRKTGFEEVSFLSLSTGDFSALSTIWSDACQRCEKEQVQLSLPSLRVGSVTGEIMEKMASLRRLGCTLAPEAGSQRLRDVINKGISEEELIRHCRLLLENGWRQVKFYFMIGLPTETDEDLEAIVRLCRKARDAGGPGAPRLKITASISSFVPKPFTPFQWESQIGLEEMKRRIDFCKSLFKPEKMLTLRWHEPASSHLEGILSRAGREMANVIEKAYRKGAIFTAWEEHFNITPWLEALAEEGIDSDVLSGARNPASALPWDHLEAGVSKAFLLREREKSRQGRITPDCRYGACGQCGACDTKAGPSLLPGSDGTAHHTRLVFRSRDQKGQSDAKRPIPTIQPRPQLKGNLAIRQAHFRIWHAKLDNFALLSQLELMAVIFRALRRARLPVSFSQGFHPLPLISFGRALPVGVQSEVEWFSLTLHRNMAPSRLKTGLNLMLPPDLGVSQVEIVEKSDKTAQAISETFRLEFNTPEQTAQACEHFAKFQDLKTACIMRRSKKGEKILNVRPLLLSWHQAGEDKIIFGADWTEGYLSPLALAETILGQDASGPAPKLVKIRQTFANGKEYELSGF